MVITSPVLIALGNEIKAIAAKMYAHHMVATPDVILAARLLLKALILLIIYLV
jgi:hypothetical protein